MENGDCFSRHLILLSHFLQCILLWMQFTGGRWEKRSECITRFLRGVSSDCPGASWSMAATGLRIDRVLGARSSTVGVAWYGIVRSRETVRFLWFIFMIPIHSEATTFFSYQAIFTVLLCGVLRFPIWSEFIHCHCKRIYDSELCISLSHSRPEMVKGRKGNGNWPRILQLLTAYDQTTQHILAKFRSRKETIIFKACGQIVGCDES